MSKVKYALTTLALSLLVLTSNVHADIRINGGSVLVSTGDSISKLLKYEKPAKTYYGTVCKKPANDRCSLSKNQSSGRIYEFKMPNRTYIVQTYGGTITYVEWRR